MMLEALGPLTVTRIRDLSMTPTPNCIVLVTSIKHLKGSFKPIVELGQVHPSQSSVARIIPPEAGIHVCRPGT
jgi:hypothetical protein